MITKLRMGDSDIEMMRGPEINGMDLKHSECNIKGIENSKNRIFVKT